MAAVGENDTGDDFRTSAVFVLDSDLILGELAIEDGSTLLPEGVRGVLFDLFRTMVDSVEGRFDTGTVTWRDTCKGLLAEEDEGEDFCTLRDLFGERGEDGWGAMADERSALADVRFRFKIGVSREEVEEEADKEA